MPVEAVGATVGLEKWMVFWFRASKTALVERLWHISMMWKDDCTLDESRGGRRERAHLWAHYCLFSTLLVTTKKNSASGHTCTHLNVANIIVAALLVTVWEIQQVSHSEERMIEDTGRNSPVFSSDEQHALQQGHKLLPVSLLCLHVTVIRTQHQVHLMGDSTEAQTQTKNWITQLKGHQFQSKPIQN